MAWLSHNWIWLALGIGVVFMMSRGGHGGHGGCCGGGGHGRGDERRDTGAPTPKDAASGGVGHQHH